MAQTEKQNAHLDSVTDYVEEKNMDSSKTDAAMATLGQSNASAHKLKKKREKELAAVKISKEDLIVIVNEFGISEGKAEQILREQGGNLEKSLTYLVRG